MCAGSLANANRRSHRAAAGRICIVAGSRGEERARPLAIHALPATPFLMLAAP